MFFLYKYVKNREVIYIGKTSREINLRIKEHKNKKDLPCTAEIYVCKCPTEAFMNAMEVLLIDKYRPKYNKDCCPLGWEKADIPFDEPEFILLEKYNEQNIPVEYIRNIDNAIVAIMSDGTKRKPEYCQCENYSLPEKTYNGNGYIYDICILCGKLIKNSLKDVEAEN